MSSSAAPDDPWTPLEEAMLATALRKAERRGRVLDTADYVWLTWYEAGYDVSFDADAETWA